jgi:acetylornithine deacetylase
VIGLERRTLPGESGADVEAELGALLDTCRAADPELDASFRVLLERDPFEADPATPVVQALLTATPGVAPGVAGASYWADAAFIAAAGIPTAMFGPGGEGAHAQVEWVSIDDTVAVTETLLAVAERLCA